MQLSCDHINIGNNLFKCLSESTRGPRRGNRKVFKESKGDRPATLRLQVLMLYRWAIEGPWTFLFHWTSTIHGVSLAMSVYWNRGWKYISNNYRSNIFVSEMMENILFNIWFKKRIMLNKSNYVFFLLKTWHNQHRNGNQSML